VKPWLWNPCDSNLHGLYRRRASRQRLSTAGISGRTQTQLVAQASGLAKLSAEMPLVRRTASLLRHGKELFGDAVRAEWRSSFDRAAHGNCADTNALGLKFQGETCDKIAQSHLAEAERRTLNRGREGRHSHDRPSSAQRLARLQGASDIYSEICNRAF